MLLAGASGAVLFLAADADSVDRVAEFVGVHLVDLDVVLADGFAPLHDLLVEVRRNDVPAKVVSGHGMVWMTITDEPVVLGNQYRFDDLAAVAQRIVDSVRP